MKYSFDKKDIFTVLNAEDAPKVDGYFGNTLQELNYAIDNQENRKLTFVYGLDVNPFCADEDCYALFLPANKVKQVEKKYRPFKSDEEITKALGIGVGFVLMYRRKDEPDMEFVSAFTGYKKYQPTGSLYSVSLGGQSYLVKTLLDKYEWFNTETDEWCPFGIEE